jgi:ParB-like chromosome segregation protein Spo0J
MIPEYEFHPIAAAFPLMSGKPLDDLVKDIKDRGLELPIELYQGMILDGRNRYLACKKAGVPIQTKNFAARDDNHAIDHVMSLNLQRRHLDKAQLGMAAQSLAAMKRGGQEGNLNAAKTNRENSPFVSETPVISLAQAAKKVGVNYETAKRARKVANAAPDLVEPVTQGEISMRQAETIIDLRKNEPDLAEAIEEKEMTVEEAKEEAKQRSVGPTVRIGAACADGKWRTVEQIIEKAGCSEKEAANAIRSSRQGTFIVEIKRGQIIKRGHAKGLHEPV